MYMYIYVYICIYIVNWMQALPNPLEDTSDVETPKQITPMMGTLVRRLLHEHHTAPARKRPFL